MEDPMRRAHEKRSPSDREFGRDVPVQFWRAEAECRASDSHSWHNAKVRDRTGYRRETLIRSLLEIRFGPSLMFGRRRRKWCRESDLLVIAWPRLARNRPLHHCFPEDAATPVEPFVHRPCYVRGKRARCAA